MQSAWQPSPGDALFGVVQRIWDFEGSLAFRREQLFPDGSLQLVVQLDEAHRPVEPQAGAPFPAVCVDGLQTATTTIEGPRGRFRVLGIRLRPLGASAFLGTALCGLTDRTTDLHALIGRSAAELATRIEAAKSGPDRVHAALGWARARASRAGEPDALVARMFQRIESDGGTRSVTQLDELSGRSRSRLAVSFRDRVGLSPKRYARVVRFRTALELLRSGPRSLGDVAFTAGYYDQAHMNAEFRELAGLTPREYAAALRFPNSSHVAL